MSRWNFKTACWIALGLGTIVALVLPIEALIYHSPDDAFFYMKTAWNFATGHGSTFDGMNPTNGYHPLWFLILSIMYWFGELLGVHSPDLFYRVAFIFQWVMFVGAWYLAARALFLSDDKGNASPGQRTSFAVLFGLLVYFFVFVRVVGSEAILSVAVISTYIFVKQDEIATGVPKFLMKAVLLALVFLSRIDFISTVVPVLLLGDALTSPRGYRLKTAFFLFAVLTGVAATYFTINLTSFGHLLTVSASWKSEFPRFLLFSNIPYYLRANPYQFARAVVAIAICLWFVIHIYRKGSDASGLDVFIAWLAAGTVLYMLQTMSFNAHKIREWYTSLPVFIALAIAARIPFRIKRIHHLVNIALATAAVAFLIGAGLLMKKWDANYHFAHALKDKLGTSAPVMIVDCAGVVGYFSGVPVVNGDGLVNSFDYLEAVKSELLDEWLIRRNVSYYATYSVAQPDSLEGKYIDWAVTGLGGMDFVFDTSQVVLQAPFSIDNIRFHSTGEWTVFKLNHDNSTGR